MPIIKTCVDDDSEDVNCESPPQITSTVDSVASSRRSRSPPCSPPPPKNPLLQERFNCEELRNVVCHLETKDLWDKFNELGTEMIITKTGRQVVKKKKLNFLLLLFFKLSLSLFLIRSDTVTNVDVNF